MDSFWAAIVYLWLAATGAFVAVVMLSWFGAVAARKEAHSRAQTSRTAATERMHQHRRVT